MLFPAEMKYSKDHEWMKEEDGVVVIGISDFAQDALGDVVFVNLPGEGDDVTCGDAFGDVESVKAVSDLVCPVTGTVCAVNEELLDHPELLNSDPYGAELAAGGQFVTFGGHIHIGDVTQGFLGEMGDAEDSFFTVDFGPFVGRTVQQVFGIAHGLLLGPGRCAVPEVDVSICGGARGPGSPPSAWRCRAPLPCRDLS